MLDWWCVFLTALTGATPKFFFSFLCFSLYRFIMNKQRSSLSLHRHSYIGFILAFASSIHNKQTKIGWGRKFTNEQYERKSLWRSKVDAHHVPIPESVEGKERGKGRDETPSCLRHWSRFLKRILGQRDRWKWIFCLLWNDKTRVKIKDLYECRCEERRKALFLL